MTDMPVRQRVSTLSVNVKTLFIIQCHTPVTIIKTTYLLTSLRFLDITNIIFSVFNPNFIFTHNTEKTLRSNPIKCVFFSHGNIAKILQIIKSQPECQDFEGLKMTSS